MGRRMENALKNLFAVSDLRNRILFTLALLGVYRVGNHIPTPGVNQEALRLFAEQAASSMFGLYNMFTGGSLARVTIFALGVMPYISSSIIIQLLTVVWPYLERISKEGELGRRKITQYTRYLTVVLAVVQAFGYAIWLERSTEAPGGLPLVFDPGLGLPVDVRADADDRHDVRHVAGRADHRARHRQRHVAADLRRHRRRTCPNAVIATFDQLQTGQIGPLRILFLLAMAVVVIGAIVFVERGHRRIVVQYAKRVVGRRQYGGSSTHIPLKVNTGGVIPVIFASSILSFFSMAGPLFEAGTWARRAIDQVGVRDAALQPAVRRGHHLLRVLLHVDHLQPR